MTACQWTAHRPCETPAAYRLTFRTRGGTEFTEAQCRAHVSPRNDQVRGLGGEIVAVEPIPRPVPAPVLLEPVGLDAVDPTPPSEPIKVRVPRRRRSGKVASGG